MIMNFDIVFPCFYIKIIAYMTFEAYVLLKKKTPEIVHSELVFTLYG